MTLTDITDSPKEVVNVPIPVNVKDDDTVIDTTSAVYAKIFSTKVADFPILAGGTKLNDWILKTSKAKGWMVATGAESKVSVKSITLTATSGNSVTF